MKTLHFFLAAILFAVNVTTLTAQTYADDYGMTPLPVSSTYCPALSISMQRGSTDAMTSGQVSMLQRFLIERGYLDIDQPTGRFAGMTVQAVKDFQEDYDLPSLGIAGSLTRAAIARVCRGAGSQNGTAPVTCTADAMQCPNGTYVGRSGPNCQFVCPTTSSVQTPTATVPPPSIVLNADKTITASGQGATLTWTAKNATKCHLQNMTTGGFEEVSASSGFRMVYPSATAAYRLYCINDPLNGTRAASEYREITISVSGSASNSSLIPQIPAPVVTSVSALPSTIAKGGASVLSWSTTGATQCFGENLYTGTRETLSLSGSMKVTPGNTTSYKIWCTNGAGAFAEKSLTVEVVESQAISQNADIPTPQITVTSSATSINKGQSATFTWSVANATKCIAKDLRSGWFGIVGTAGSQVTTPSVTTTFQLYCQNDPLDGRVAQSAFKNFTLEVVGGSAEATSTVPVVITSVNASPSFITVGQSTTVSWSTTGANQCLGQNLVTQTIEELPPNGSMVLAPTTTTSYKIWCTNGAGGSAEKTLTVIVGFPGSTGPFVLGANSQCLDIRTKLLHLERTDSSSDGEVSLLQAFLVGKGFMGGNVTGYYGRLTSDAVSKYQSSKNIEVTGNVGELTKAAIKRDTCN